MALRTYSFSSTFTLEAPRKRVHDVLVDLEFYADWWPQVLAVAKIDDDHALVVCRSTLPYDLELELSAVRRDAASQEPAYERIEPPGVSIFAPASIRASRNFARRSNALDMIYLPLIIGVSAAQK